MIHVEQIQPTKEEIRVQSIYVNRVAWANFWLEIATVLLLLIIYTDTTLAASCSIDNRYDYRVTAFNAAGESAPSNTVSKTIPKILCVPAAPSNAVLK